MFLVYALDWLPNMRGTELRCASLRLTRFARASDLHEEVATQQGFAPIKDYRFLLGVLYPGDESVEEFETMLREWRREGHADAGK